MLLVVRDTWQRVRKIERKTKMFVKGRFFEELPWRVVQHITSDEDHDCFGAISSNSPRRVVQCIYRNLVVSFREQIAFVFKTDYFTRIRLRNM